MSLRYKDVPYHNFWHCVDVAHTTFLCLSKTRHRTAVTLQESLALLVAAVCHDLEHPGTLRMAMLTSQCCSAKGAVPAPARLSVHAGLARLA